MNVGIIGDGAIAQYVTQALAARGHKVAAVLMRPERVAEMPDLYVGSVAELPDRLRVMIDCAGHQALAAHGPAILTRGMDVITLSLGALADDTLATALDAAARKGAARLHLASGAIGALDCLSAARVGTMERVEYVGRKPPKGWRGSPAEDVLDLANLQNATAHFEGSARAAALAYPKNANVAAAVALAGVGFDATQVSLVADPAIDQNIHQVTASGDFGSFTFQITGNALPDNPRSSALAAMSVLSKLDQITQPIAI